VEVIQAQDRCAHSDFRWVAPTRDKLKEGLDQELQARNLCLKTVCKMPEASPPPVLSEKEYSEMDRQIDQIIRMNKEAYLRNSAKWEQDWNKVRSSLANYKNIKGADAVGANLAMLNSLESFRSRTQTEDVDLNTAIETNFPRLTKNDLQQIQKAMESHSRAFYNGYNQESIKAALREANPAIRQRKLLELAEQKRRELDSLQKSSPQMYFALPDLEEFRVDPEQKEKINRAQPINFFEENNLLNGILQVNADQEILTHPEKYPELQRVPDLEKFITPREFAASTKDPEYIRAFDAKANTCAANLKKLLRQLPSEQERGEAHVIADSARLAVEKKWTNYFSVQTASIIRERLKSTVLELPPSPHVFISQFKTIAAKDQAQAESSITRSREGLLQKRGLASSVYWVDSYQPEGWAASTNFCSINAQLVKDSFEMNSESRRQTLTVRLAGSDVRSSDRAFQVSLHEFSHASDPELLTQIGFKISGHSLAKRNRLAACLKSQHGPNLKASLQSTPTRVKITDRYSSIEDFADILPKDNTDFCRNISPNSLAGDAYSNYITDRHSPDTFRILQGEFNRNGRLTKECQSYVDTFKKWKFKDCLKEAE
jgi:hypothetical protein